MPIAYLPSNRIGSNTFLLLIPMLIASGVLGVIYGVAMRFIPLIILDLLLVFGFAFVSGYAAMLAIRIGKCRNPLFALAYGLLSGLVGVAASHYTMYLLQCGGMSPMPSFMDYVHLRVKSGWTIGRVSSSSSGGAPISGFFVWLCWGIEAVVIILGAGLRAQSQAFEPFCEPCEQWATKESVRFAAPGLSTATINQMRSGKFEDILSPPMNEVKVSNDSLTYRVRVCPSCNSASFLDLIRTVIVTDKKGNTNEKKQVVCNSLQLAPEEVEAVTQLRDDVSAVLSSKTDENGAASPGGEPSAPPTEPPKSA